MSAVHVRDLVELTKPRITRMVLLTTACGLWLAPGRIGGLRALCLLLGTALVVASANTLNMYIERDIDGKMARTRNRPLPAGRLDPKIALLFGLALGFLSVPLLALGVNLLTALLGVLSFLIYVVIYTPLKQHSPLALVVGAVPGAMPPLMGWTAATSGIEIPGLLLFALMFLWQLPHYLAITLYRTDEIAKAGYRVTVMDRGVSATKLRIVLYLAALLPVSLLLVPCGVAGIPYLIVAGISGSVFFGLGLYGLRRSAGRRWARSLFSVSLVYLTLIFLALLLPRVPLLSGGG